MSANNWATCPRCLAKSRDEIEKRAAQLDAQHGATPAKDWMAEVRKLDDMRKPIGEDLREDWELGVTRDGKFKVVYWCRCDKCDFAWQYRYETDVFNGSGDA